MWKKWIRLPGCKAITGPSKVPFLNQETQFEAHAVRGMKLWICSEYSSTADWLGDNDLIPCVWHFLMMRTTYLAMCSVMVKTLPCPIGALGPRNASTKLITRISKSRMYVHPLTEVVWEVWHGAGHVCLGCFLRPQILKIPCLANNREARTERDVEPCRAYDGIDLYNFPRRCFETLGHNLDYRISDYPDVWLSESFKVAHTRRETTTSQGEIGNQGLAESGVSA